MAKPITNIEPLVPDAAAEQAQAMGELMQALTANKTAILQFLDIMNELQKFGLLEALQAMLKNKQDIAVIAMTQLNKPGAQHILKNGMNALAFLSRIQPTQLEAMLNGVAGGLEKASKEASDNSHKGSMGMWGMLKTMRDPEVNTSMQFMLNFLRGMGDGLQNSAHENNAVH